MAPLLSPGKTWAGFFGALVVAGLASYLWLQFAHNLFSENWFPNSVIVCLSYGVLVSTAGLVGDLCESLIKRDLNKKDAAALLPGFGGLVDITDSIVYAGPIAYLLWLALPPATWTAAPLTRLAMAVPSPFHWL
jgi:phosphatidate cytidylyltransferase